MDENKKKIIVPELTLLLIYLTGWEETKSSRAVVKKTGENSKKQFRAWKGYRYEVLEELEQQGLIYKVPGGKSLLVHDKGKQKARELIKKYIG
jgi:ribosomal protein S19E (S16A)